MIIQYVIISPINFPVVTHNDAIITLFIKHPKPIPKIGPGTPIKTAIATIPILITFNDLGYYLKYSISPYIQFFAPFEIVNTRNIPTTNTQ